jgi:hypothetical protein
LVSDSHAQAGDPGVNWFSFIRIQATICSWTVFMAMRVLFVIFLAETL